MLPFTVDIRPGSTVHEQVVYAVERALIEGRLRPGDRFPSVRTLSKELRINPNTAHKIVSSLVDDGVLEVRPGIGTLISEAANRSHPEDKERLLREGLERLVVECKRAGLRLDEVVAALRRQWEQLGGDMDAATDARNEERNER